MSKKKVETPNNGQATTAQVYKLRNGKLVTKEQRDEIRKEQEEMYKTRRINAFTRRCKRMGISEEDTAKYVEKLVAQLEAPHTYAIHVIFDTKVIYDRIREVDEETGEEKWKTKQKQASNLAKEAILNAKIDCKILTNNWAYVIGDSTVLAKLREVLAGLASITPHIMKAEPILPVPVKEKKKPSNNNKDVAAKAKKERKSKSVEPNSSKGIMCFRKRVNEMRKSKEQRKKEKAERKDKGITYRTRKAYTGPFAGKTAAEKKKISANMKAHARSVKESRIASKKQTGTTVPITSKKGSTGLEKASTGLKQAA